MCVAKNKSAENSLTGGIPYQIRKDPIGWDMSATVVKLALMYKQKRNDQKETFT